jgi:ABC-type transport system substrate-binding protein
MPGRVVSIILVGSVLVACGCGGMSNPYAGEEGLKVIHNRVSQDPKGLDPVKSSDVLSSSFIAQTYECLYEHSYLERPYRVRPCLAEDMPEITDNRLTYTIRIKRRVHFQDNPCFEKMGGKGRELVAQDFVYSLKRLADAQCETKGFWLLEGYITGLDEFYKASQDKKRKTDYSRKVEGLKAPGRYTLKITLEKPYPRLLWVLAMTYTAAVAREAVEYYGEEFVNNPVGTGPFVLKSWHHWHKIVMERNPTFREEYYPSQGEPPNPQTGYPGDEAAGLLADAGKKLPLVDRVVWTIIKQDQPAWLYFLSGYIDMSSIPKDSWNTAMASLMDLSPQMRAKGVKLYRTRSYSVGYTAFNMNGPVLGMKYPEAAKKEIAGKRKAAKEAEAAGEKEKASQLQKEADELEKLLPRLPELNEKRRKLRQAMSLAYNRPERIDIFANGRAERAHGPIPPEFPCWDPDFINPYTEYNLEKAKKLLAEAGYPGGIGPDGKQLKLDFETTGTSTGTIQYADFFRQEMKKLGIKLKINQNTWTEFMNKLDNNTAQVYALSWLADYPDAENFLQLFYGPSGQGAGPNNANYNNPEYDRLFDEMSPLSDFDPEDAERKYELCRRMEKMVAEDCPWIFGLNYYSYTLCHLWRKNFKPHPFAYNTMKYHSVDPELRLKLSMEWNRPTMWPAYVFLSVIAAVGALFVYKVKKQSE